MLVVVGIFVFFQFGFLQPAEQAVSTSSYSINKVVTDMQAGGPYDKAQALIPSGGTVVSQPVVPIVPESDLGKTDLSKYNQ